jgi:hypothetical protein
MVPTKFVPSAVAMLANPSSQFLYLCDELDSRKSLKIFVHTQCPDKLRSVTFSGSRLKAASAFLAEVRTAILSQPQWAFSCSEHAVARRCFHGLITKGFR